MKLTATASRSPCSWTKTHEDEAVKKRRTILKNYHDNRGATNPMLALSRRSFERFKATSNTVVEYAAVKIEAAKKD
jgi:hypothetical protein